jgi:hypothetical protein
MEGEKRKKAEDFKKEKEKNKKEIKWSKNLLKN